MSICAFEISLAKSFKPNTYVDRFRAQQKREWQRKLAENWCYASHGYAQIHVSHLMYWKAISDARRAMIRQILSASIKRSLNIDLSIRYQWFKTLEPTRIPRIYQKWRSTEWQRKAWKRCNEWNEVTKVDFDKCALSYNVLYIRFTYRIEKSTQMRQLHNVNLRLSSAIICSRCPNWFSWLFDAWRVYMPQHRDSNDLENWGMPCCSLAAHKMASLS